MRAIYDSLCFFPEVFVMLRHIVADTMARIKFKIKDMFGQGF